MSINPARNSQRPALVTGAALLTLEYDLSLHGSETRGGARAIFRQHGRELY
jgi:hypothetical protein